MVMSFIKFTSFVPVMWFHFILYLFRCWHFFFCVRAHFSFHFRCHSNSFRQLFFSFSLCPIDASIEQEALMVVSYPEHLIKIAHIRWKCNRQWFSIKDSRKTRNFNYNQPFASANNVICTKVIESECKNHATASNSEECFAAFNQHDSYLCIRNT